MPPAGACPVPSSSTLGTSGETTGRAVSNGPNRSAPTAPSSTPAVDMPSRPRSYTGSGAACPRTNGWCCSTGTAADHTLTSRSPISQAARTRIDELAAQGLSRSGTGKCDIVVSVTPMPAEIDDHATWSSVPMPGASDPFLHLVHRRPGGRLLLCKTRREAVIRDLPVDGRGDRPSRSIGTGTTAPAALQRRTHLSAADASPAANDPSSGGIRAGIQVGSRRMGVPDSRSVTTDPPWPSADRASRGYRAI